MSLTFLNFVRAQLYPLPFPPPMNLLILSTAHHREMLELGVVSCAENLHFTHWSFYFWPLFSLVF